MINIKNEIKIKIPIEYELDDVLGVRENKSLHSSKDQEKIIKDILSSNGYSQDEIEILIKYVTIDNLFWEQQNDSNEKYLTLNISLEPKVEVKKEIEDKTEDNEEHVKNQTMLQEYYGDREREKSYREAFKRIKEHVTTEERTVVDKSGNNRTITVKTIAKYDGDEADFKECMLEGYKQRLERISAAEQGDFSLYEIQVESMTQDMILEMLEKYIEVCKEDKVRAEEIRIVMDSYINDCHNPETKKKIIQALIDQDSEIIQTNNYSYNSHQNTQENLKTLGRIGEKSGYKEVDKDDSMLKKMGTYFGNIIIFLRNYTPSRFLNRMTGTLIVAPVHRLIFGTKTKELIYKDVDGYSVPDTDRLVEISQKTTAGLFKNKRMHRYQARREYFEYEIQKEREESGKKLGIFAKTVLPRVRAITRYREGNANVLNIGVAELMDNYEKRNFILEKKQKAVMLESQNEEYLNELAALNIIKEKNVEDENSINEINKKIDKKILENEKRIKSIDSLIVDSVQPDVISMYQHDTANKTTMTAVITGIKEVITISKKKLLGNYVYQEIEDNCIEKIDELQWEQNLIKTLDKASIVQEPEINLLNKFGDETFNKEFNDYLLNKLGDVQLIQEIEEGLKENVDVEQTHKIINFLLKILKQDGSEDISFKDVLSDIGLCFSKSTVKDGKIINIPTEYVRGIQFMYNGKVYSVSDGNGFDYVGQTMLEDRNIGNKGLIEIIKTVLLNSDDKISLSSFQIAEMLVSGKIANLQGLMSGSSFGEPDKWSEPLDMKSILKHKSHFDEKKEAIEEKMINLMENVHNLVSKVPPIAFLRDWINRNNKDYDVFSSKECKSKEVQKEIEKKGKKKKGIKGFQRPNKEEGPTRYTGKFEDERNIREIQKNHFTGRKKDDMRSEFDEDAYGL